MSDSQLAGVKPKDQQKLKAAFYLVADVLESAPEALAGIRLNRLTGLVEAFNPAVNEWMACSNNIRETD
jgi:hypothetical protein